MNIVLRMVTSRCKASSLVMQPYIIVIETYICGNLEAQESLSDEALVHLKSYKYSSVDKSFISRYILKHYVRLPLRQRFTNPSYKLMARVGTIVECIRRASAIMDCSQYGHPTGIYVHFDQCDIYRDIYARSRRTGMQAVDILLNM